jgi:hypothetical protein
MADINFTVDVPRGQERFRELILYVSKRCVNDATFGATMLNKILYYADFQAYERLGMPLTGVPYFRIKNGPAPFLVRKVRRDLVEEGALLIEEVPYGNYTQHRSVALRDADISLFSKGEIEIVDQVIEALSGKTATKISYESHKTAWHVLGDKERIPYEAAFFSDEGANASDIKDARRLNEKYGWELRA